MQYAFKRGRKSLSSSNEAKSEHEAIPASLFHPGHYIRRLHQISVSIFLKEAEHFQITNVQYAALGVIQHMPGLDQQRLGRLIALDRQNVSDVVKRLCDKGLVERRRKDGRTNALYLTDLARARLRPMATRLAVVDDVILKPLPAKDRQTFMAMLVTLVEGNNNLSRAPHGAER